MESNAISPAQRLLNRRILLVEDDAGLTERYDPNFRKEGATIAVKRCMATAKDELMRNGDAYDLVILDIMLPRSERDLTDIEKLDSALGETRRVIREHDDPGQHGTETLAAAYDKRTEILAERERLIDDEGGLKVVVHWTEAGDPPGWRPPVLFLTSAGNEDAVTRGTELMNGRCKWYVKPVPDEKIIDMSIELIEHFGRGGEDNT